MVVEPVPRALPSARAVAGLHDLLRHHRDRRGLDRAQEVRGAGGRRRLQEAPVGLGPYKFVSHTPGVELVMEANEGYWRKMPSVKRLVFKSVPEPHHAAGHAEAGRGRHRLPARRARRPRRSSAIPTSSWPSPAASPSFYLDFLDQWDPKSPWHDRRVRLAANYAIDRQALSEAETLGASKPAGNHVPRTFEFALPLEPVPLRPGQGQAAPGRGGLPQRLRRRRAAPAPALLLAGRGDRRLPPGGRHPDAGCGPMERAAFYRR